MYRQQYKLAKETLAAQPKSKQFDFDEQVGNQEGTSGSTSHCRMKGTKGSWSFVSMHVLHAALLTRRVLTSVRMLASYLIKAPITIAKVFLPPALDGLQLEQAIFLKFDLFSKRLYKLIDMFTTIHQFSSLEQHTHIEGLDTMLKSLNNIIDDVKRKPYDLLDYSKNAFDRDFLEFNVNINDLELQLQVCWPGEEWGENAGRPDAP